MVRFEMDSVKPTILLLLLNSSLFQFKNCGRKKKHFKCALWMSDEMVAFHFEMCSLKIEIRFDSSFHVYSKLWNNMHRTLTTEFRMLRHKFNKSSIKCFNH